jgi:hypothetical protein
MMTIVHFSFLLGDEICFGLISWCAMFGFLDQSWCLYPEQLLGYMYDLSSSFSVDLLHV